MRRGIEIVLRYILIRGATSNPEYWKRLYQLIRVLEDRSHQLAATGHYGYRALTPFKNGPPEPRGPRGGFG